MTHRLSIPRWIIAPVWCLCVFFIHVRAESGLIAFEEFNYDAVGGDLNGNGGGGSFGFSDSWTGQTSYNIGNGSLVSPVDPLPKMGNSVSAVAFGENRGIDRNFASPVGAEGSSLYVSALMQPIGILHQGAYGGWFGLALRGDNGNAFLSIGKNYSQGAYGIRLADLYASSGVAATVGTTVFLVARIDYTEGVDPIYLYVNPQPGGPEPATASASLIDYDVQVFKQLSLTGPGASAIDAIRIGTSYADVNPAVADFQGDGAVDDADLDLWTGGFGIVDGATHMQGDANDDGRVDGGDFLIWQRQVGFELPDGGATSQVPEPACWRLVLLAAALGWRRPTRGGCSYVASRPSR